MDEQTRERKSHVIATRYEKLEALQPGIEPFAYSYDVTHSTTAAREAFEVAEQAGTLGDDGEGPQVRVAGRLTALRGHGRRPSPTSPIGAERSRCISARMTWARTRIRSSISWTRATGSAWKGRLPTRMGEVTVRARSFQLLAKSLRPLPFGKEEIDPETGERKVYSGFADVEQRYRQRYADLAVNPEVREVFFTRAKLVKAIRRFLDDLGYVEVETPILQPLYGGASARPFTTHHHALDMPLYLRIADELYLKRLIVGGFERVYEIGKDFRNEGIDRTHNPEFTMLEFYQAYADYEAMMNWSRLLLAVVREVTGGSTTVTYQKVPIDFAPPYRRLSIRALRGTATSTCAGWMMALRDAVRPSPSRTWTR